MPTEASAPGHSSHPPSLEPVRRAVMTLVEPPLDRTLAQAKMLKTIDATPEGGTSICIELPTPAYPDRSGLAQRVEETARRSGAPGPIQVYFESHVLGKDSGAKIGLKCRNVIAVGSGKGGVGKSTVATSLAFGLQSLGCRVGLMDADVYGPSVPHLVGAAKAQPMARKVQTQSGELIDRIDPIEVAGVKVMSMGFFVQRDQAVIWRGPLLHRAISQFLSETEWGELDYLIIDMPPGTGDVSLTLSQMLGLAGAVVVCTPQQVALLDAYKAISMFRQVKIPVLGIVENMTGEIFGRGGARTAAQELGLPFLGEIPIDATVRIRGDDGNLASLFLDENPSRAPLLAMCEQVALQVAREALQTPAAPKLEIL